MYFVLNRSLALVVVLAVGLATTGCQPSAGTVQKVQKAVGTLTAVVNSGDAVLEALAADKTITPEKRDEITKLVDSIGLASSQIAAEATSGDPLPAQIANIENYAAAVVFPRLDNFSPGVRIAITVAHIALQAFIASLPSAPVGFAAHAAGSASVTQALSKSDLQHVAKIGKHAGALRARAAAARSAN